MTTASLTTGTAPHSASGTEPMIHLHNVRKTYRNAGREFIAISNVTMDIAEGELVSLVGPSGCGKSSLVKAGLFPKIAPKVVARENA